MTTLDPSAPLTDDERAWLHARAAALGLAPEQVHATPFAATEGRMLLSTDPGASLVPVRHAEGGAVFLAETAHVAAGETLAITCPRGDPVRVLLGRLTLAAGARVAAHTHLTLEAATLVVDRDGPIELIGRDGKNGDSGPPGATGEWGRDEGRGGTGGPGDKGEPGQPGPGGNLWFAEVTGTLTVIAGGGNGGNGGPGGTGGRGADGDRVTGGCPGGNGGPGGPGGDAGDGGSVVIAFGKMAEGAEIHPLARPNEPGKAGGAGPPGHAGSPGGNDGSWGSPGKDGHPGNAPDFAIRCLAQAPA
jgi:hypothetical protein